MEGKQQEKKPKAAGTMSFTEWHLAIRGDSPNLTHNWVGLLANDDDLEAVLTMDEFVTQLKDRVGVEGAWEIYRATKSVIDRSVDGASLAATSRMAAVQSQSLHRTLLACLEGAMFAHLDANQDPESQKTAVESYAAFFEYAHRDETLRRLADPRMSKAPEGNPRNRAISNLRDALLTGNTGLAPKEIHYLSQVVILP